jgi:hypothetical protein
MNTTTKRSDQFMTQLLELISRQGMTIPLIETHDHNSIICSGNIIGIQIVCQCSKSSGSTDNQVNQSIKIDSSKDVSSPSF